MQEVTGSSPVPSTKTRASDLGQGLFCCVCHRLTSEQDGTGLEKQRRRPRPAAETGRSCWGRVRIFQGPAKGLRKNPQTQPVRPFPRPLGMSTKKDAAAGVPFQPTPVRASNPNNNDQRQGIIMAMVSCLWCYISLFFHGRVWYTRLSSTNRNLQTKRKD